MNEYSQRNLARFFLGLILIFFISACRIGSLPINPASPSSPTSFPVQPTEFILPSITLKSEVSIPEPIFDETPPVTFPEDSIWIQTPKKGANVSGILSVKGISDPSFEQNLVIRLVDQNNSEILRTNTFIHADSGSRRNFSTAIEIPLINSQPGILQVFSVSPKDGSLVHLSSVTVSFNTENSEGSPTISNERILVNSVHRNMTGSDEEVNVAGVAWGLFENSLNYAVCGEITGNNPDLVCGTMENRLLDGIITTHAVEMGLPGDFVFSIPNILTFPSSATLVIYSISPMNGSIDHAASFPLFGNK